MLTTLDDTDRALLARRAALYHTDTTGPTVGEYVDFADGVSRRISHVWNLDEGPWIQTSDHGSWYLGDGWCSFSGSLHPGIDAATLTRTSATRLGAVWFFHHDTMRAHNGVYATMPFAVYTCTLNAKETTHATDIC